VAVASTLWARLSTQLGFTVSRRTKAFPNLGQFDHILSPPISDLSRFPRTVIILGLPSARRYQAGFNQSIIRARQIATEDVKRIQ
jgi:hypothetical protein